MGSRRAKTLGCGGSQVSDDGEIIVSGIADAVAYDAEGRIEVIVDWESDITIGVSTLNSYRGQLDTYRQFTGATRALLVLVTAGVSQMPFSSHARAWDARSSPMPSGDRCRPQEKSRRGS
jgi:hypothetical protein